MAGIGGGIPVSRQFSAIAWVRWRLFANAFRRKGSTGELIANIVVFPFAALFIVGPTVGAGVGAWALVSNHLPQFLAGIFWAVTVIQILVSINFGPPGTTFDQESLVRYPLSFPRYLAVRLFLGLLSVSNILGTCALLAAAAGIAVADGRLGGVAFVAMLALALTNMLFLRMVFAWVDRWLSTRRAREVMLVLVFAFSIGIQYVNVTVNNVGHKSTHAEQQARLARMNHFLQVADPVLKVLPAGLAGRALTAPSAAGPAFEGSRIAGILAYAALFLGIFAWRMQREYRGENLSQAAASAVEPARRSAESGLRRAESTDETAHSPLFSPVISALLQKEWTYVRRNPAQFYGLVAPLAMVALFASRMGNFARTGMTFPAAVAYSILGIAALAYNVLGADAEGVQFYFLAPVSLRSVFLAKNLFGFATTLVQVVVVYLLILFTAGSPPVWIALSTVAWVVFAVLVNATVGNMRSIIAPKKVDPSKLSRKQASQLSALLCIGILLVVAGLGFGLLALARLIDREWLPVPVLLALGLGAFALYVTGLNHIDTLAADHRETLVEELTKTS